MHTMMDITILRKMQGDFIDLSINDTISWNFASIVLPILNIDQNKDRIWVLTESNVGFMVYLVSLGFFVDSPSSCNVNTTPIIAAETKSFLYLKVNLFFHSNCFTH